MATDADKARFRRQTGEDWNAPPPPPPPPPKPKPNPGPATVPMVGPVAAGQARPWVPVASLGEMRQGLAKTEDTRTLLNLLGEGQPGSVLDPKASFPVYGPDIPDSVKQQQRIQQLSGAEKLAQQMAHPPGYAGKKYGHDYDQWLLNLPVNPNDPAYSEALIRERQAAIGRERNRGQDMARVLPDPNVKPGFSAAATGRIKADQKAQQDDEAFFKGEKRKHEQVTAQDRWGDLPSVINAYGEEIPTAKALTAQGGLKPPLGGLASPGGTQADGIADGDGPVDRGAGSADKKKTTGDGRQWPVDPMVADSTSKAQLERSGKVIWMGKATVRRGGNDVQVDQYMSVDDAYYLPLKVWTPQQIAQFQHVTGNKITGVMDKPTRADWATLVETANYYTVAGLHIDPMMAATSAAAGKGGGGGGGGGGRGGGGGGAAVPADQAKFLLNQTMRQYVGREATDAEFNAFLGAIKGAAGSPDFDGQQWAIDWVKNQLPSQVGSFQAATDYYSVVQSLIGGK